MSAPTSSKVGAVVRETDSLEQTAESRNTPCPWPCILSGKVVALQTVEGYIAATWCRECDQAVTRAQWLALLEDGAI